MKLQVLDVLSVLQLNGDLPSRDSVGTSSQLSGGFVAVALIVAVPSCNMPLVQVTWIDAGRAMNRKTSK